MGSKKDAQPRGDGASEAAIGANVIRMQRPPKSTPDALYEEGRRLCDQGDYAEALKCLRSAHDADPEHAKARSYLGLCIGLEERRFDRAVEFCASAVKQEFFNPELYLNLARVHLVFGFKSEGRRYLLRGRMIDPGSREIAKALQGLGARKDPVLPFLPRRHVLNRWLGSARYAIVHRSGLRAAA